MISEEDIQLIKELKEIKDKGRVVNSTVVTNLYNKILNKNVPSTNCGSCLRKRIEELYMHLNQIETNNTKTEE